MRKSKAQTVKSRLMVINTQITIYKCDLTNFISLTAQGSADGIRCKAIIAATYTPAFETTPNSDILIDFQHRWSQHRFSILITVHMNGYPIW